MSSEVGLWENNNQDLVQRGLNEQVWNALKSSLYPGAQDNSVLMVVDYCRAQHLDPMLKPVHIVPMKVGTGQKDQWGNDIKAMRDVVLPGIGLYRTIAARSDAYAGMGEPIFGPLVTIDCNKDIWTDKPNGQSGRQKHTEAYQIQVPEWCSVTVEKLVGGQVRQFTAKEYWLENFAEKSDGTPNSMWAKRPYGQLAKCTEAQALRKAFPEVGALPTAEEMEGKYSEPVVRDVTPQPTSQPQQQSAASQSSDSADAAPEKPSYPQEKLDENLGTWRTAIDAGRTSPEHLIATMSCRYFLSAAQKDQILQLQALEGKAA